MATRVQVQHDDFDVSQLYDALKQSSQTGAVTMFIGLVRDFTATDNNIEDSVFELEHYPGMTEHNLQKIVADAKSRWPLEQVTVIHRIGKLTPQEQIVFVGVSAEHRQEAFSACEFIMDYLKSRAAFWKKESQTNSSEWVTASAKDEAKLKHW